MKRPGAKTRAGLFVFCSTDSTSPARAGPPCRHRSFCLALKSRRGDAADERIHEQPAIRYARQFAVMASLVQLAECANKSRCATATT